MVLRVLPKDTKLNRLSPSVNLRILPVKIERICKSVFDSGQSPLVMSNEPHTCSTS